MQRQIRSSIRSPSIQSCAHTRPADDRASNRGSRHGNPASRDNDKEIVSRVETELSSRLSLTSACALLLFQRGSPAKSFHVCAHVVFSRLPLPTQRNVYASQEKWQRPDKRNAPSASISIRPGHEVIRARVLRYLLRESYRLFRRVHIVQANAETGACSSSENNRNDLSNRPK